MNARLINLVANFSEQFIQTGSIILISFLVISVISIIALQLYLFDPSWFSRRISSVKALRSRIFVRKAMGSKELQQAVKDSGFEYDFKQDIFYSSMNPWQRDFGYSRMYDDLCPSFGMIVDSEPIYFYYGGKNWLIEFWKGQYDLTTGCEVGVYTKEGLELDRPEKAHYDCASNRDRLYISYSVKKRHRTLFARKDKHWWLTGFMLGEFSEPSELVMEVNITFKNSQMREAFLTGLAKTGYKENEYYVTGNTVNVMFNKPHSRQPSSRTPITDRIIQEKNFFLCKAFVELTASENNINGKMNVIEKHAPDMVDHIVNIGRTRQLFKKANGEQQL